MCFSHEPDVNLKVISTSREVAWYIISAMVDCLSVCLYVCMHVCQTITFESLDVGSSDLHIRYISGVYGA